MKIKLKVIALVTSVLGALCSISPCVSESLSGVSLEEVITLHPGGAQLRLKGAAIKSNARQAVYLGGLYLENDKDSVSDIIKSEGAKRFVILTNQDIKADAIIRALNLGISVNHSEAELLSLSPKIEKFNAIWKSEIKQGDEICIDYNPQIGTVISINGIQKGIVEGEDFYKAFLKTWLGDKPLNPSIKTQLLGKR